MFSTIRKLGFLRQASKTGAFFAAMSEPKFITTSGGLPNFDSLTVRQNKFSLELSQKQKIKITNRTLTTIPARSTFSKEEIQEFKAVFPDLARDLTEYASQSNSTLVQERFAQALEFNVPRGSHIRGLITVSTFKQLANKIQLTPENIRLAQYLGWCVEMFQNSLAICDDMVDKSITRRGQPCWYQIEDVGMTAINDCFMIKSGIFYILRKYFSHTDYYVKLLELFQETAFASTVGQSLDLQLANKDVTSFTMEIFKITAFYKISFYSLYLPVALAMKLAGLTDEKAFKQAKLILLEMGTFMQVQNDFLDCFGDPAVTGKIGTDIQCNKCTWLSVVCMQRASDEQKDIMRECYGQNDEKKVARVKHLYRELGIPNIYAIYEEESYNKIETYIQQTPSCVPPAIFFMVMNKIYQRNS